MLPSNVKTGNSSVWHLTLACLLLACSASSSLHSLQHQAQPAWVPSNLQANSDLSIVGAAAMLAYMWAECPSIRQKASPQGRKIYTVTLNHKHRKVGTNKEVDCVNLALATLAAQYAVAEWKVSLTSAIVP